MKDPMLQFYRSHEVSPVRQDIQDLTRHFDRRGSLYRLLGLAPGLVRGARVLEVGPGSGHNSLYTASLGPAHYELLEGNEKGIADIRALFGKFSKLGDCVSVKHGSLFALEEPDEPFDVVLCEGVLGGVPDPKEALRILSTQVRSGGVLVVTTMDTISMLADILRRTLAYRAVDRSLPIKEQVAVLLPLLEPHLRKLPGMSRRHDDWIIDTIMLPINGGYNCLSIPEVLVGLENDFAFLGSSPSFLDDWRWYKDIHSAEKRSITGYVDAYWRKAHNLISFNHVFPERAPDGNKKLNSACHEFREAAVSFESSRSADDLARCASTLGALASLAGEFSSDVAAALEEARTILRSEKEHQALLKSSKLFSGMFGRTQQYISLLRD